MRIITSAFLGLCAVLGVMASQADAAPIPPVGVGGAIEDFGIGDTIVFNDNLSSGEGSLSFSFRAASDLIVTDILVTLVGSQPDLGRVAASFSNGADSVLSGSVPPLVAGGSSFLFAFVEEFGMAANEVVSVTFSEITPLSGTVTTDLRFSAVAIPVPAALPLMFAGLAGLGALRLKRRKAA